MNPSDVLPLEDIQASVERFVQHALANPRERFFVTRVGCGLSGYADAQIAPMFRQAPMNCSLPLPWRPYVT